MAYPLAVFWWRGWQRRADEVLGSLDPSAKRRYLSLFHKQDEKNNKNMTEQDAVDAFEAFYVDEYGRKRFFVPIAFFLLVALVENFFLAQALQALVDAGTAGGKLIVTTAAIAGAYTFVSWDLFTRMQQKTLSRTGILGSALRLAVAVPIGFAFSSALESYAIFVAFGVGAFPLQTISVLFQRQIKKYLSLETTETAARDQVFSLAGIDTATSERIGDADITTITQLAWADPVGLTMRTNLQFAFVLDIISQALAWVYLEDKLKSLGVVGLRGAIEIRQALETIGLVDAREDAIDSEEAAENADRLTVELRERVMTPGEIRETDAHLEAGVPGPPDPVQAPSESDQEEAKAVRAAIDQAAKIAQVEPAAMLYALIQVGQDPTASFLRISWDSLTSAR